MRKDDFEATLALGTQSSMASLTLVTKLEGQPSAFRELVTPEILKKFWDIGIEAPILQEVLGFLGCYVDAAAPGVTDVNQERKKIFDASLPNARMTMEERANGFLKFSAPSSSYGWVGMRYDPKLPGADERLQGLTAEIEVLVEAVFEKELEKLLPLCEKLDRFLKSAWWFWDQKHPKTKRNYRSFL